MNRAGGNSYKNTAERRWLAANDSKIQQQLRNIAGVDFDHCERGRCKGCSETQQRDCEREVDAAVRCNRRRYLLGGGEK